MFAKYWQPDSVKTRLAGGIGAANAARVYHAFVVALASRFETVADRRLLCFAPPERLLEFSALAEPHWTAVPQATGNLGERMSAFFREAFRSGANRVVLIGSDSPTLPTANVARAFELLSEHDVVLGPTPDGGYYLIGARTAAPTIFEDVAWSTPHVFRQTIERLRAADLTYEQLPTWYDVDELADLIRLRDELLRREIDESWSETLLATVQEVL
jgi:rSAM/selenodomain-associated transferase 1